MLSHMRFDLHVHSKFSRDCLLEPKHIVSVAKRRGIHGIAITDHDVSRPFLRIVSKNVIIIRGSEVKTEVGDITGLFLAEGIKSNTSFRVIDEIKDQGGLVVLPHPFKGHTLLSKIIEDVDAIEGFNARVPLRENERAIELCLKRKKPMIAGSDAHFMFEVGRGLTLIPYASSEEEIRKAILNNNVSIKGLQFSDKYLSMIYTGSKAVEATKNPKIISSLAFKSLHRYILRRARIR